MHTLTAAFFLSIFWPRCRRMPVCCMCANRNVAFLASLVTGLKQKEKWILSYISYTVVPHTNSIHRNDSITMLADTSEMGD